MGNGFVKTNWYLHILGSVVSRLIEDLQCRCILSNKIGPTDSASAKNDLIILYAHKSEPSLYSDVGKFHFPFRPEIVLSSITLSLL